MYYSKSKDKFQITVTCTLIAKHLRLENLLQEFGREEEGLKCEAKFIPLCCTGTTLCCYEIMPGKAVRTNEIQMS